MRQEFNYYFSRPDPFSNTLGLPNNEHASAEQAKVFDDITPIPECSYRSGGRIGPGKIKLLENIRACGSISAAGRAMEMSYMRAWLLVNEINRICGRAAVERQVGGKNGGGAVLTPFGLSLVARYRKIERSVESAAREELLALQADMGAREKV
jgi:molybdate transport system regulatory protein